MDTPFWEQLQYIDDTRIQALTSYAVTGDARLARQALQAFNDSRIPDGLTQSRYPSTQPQFIPNFSLSYVDMLHDYWMYQRDDAIVKQLLPGTRSILQWFYERQFSDGFLQKMPYWTAVDSPPGVRTFPRMDHDGRSALVTLIFVDALQHAAQLEDAVGDKAIAAKERQVARRASSAVYRRCWNAKRNLLADTPDQTSFSEHTNIFGALTDTIPVRDQPAVMEKLISLQLGHDGDEPPKIAQVSYHYQFYLSRALDKGRLRPAVPGHAGTLAYDACFRADNNTRICRSQTRSDTHAWSAPPDS